MMVEWEYNASDEEHTSKPIAVKWGDEITRAEVEIYRGLEGWKARGILRRDGYSPAVDLEGARTLAKVKATAEEWLRYHAREERDDSVASMAAGEVGV